ARSPGFTLVAVITLALGIGVNTTLFTAFDAVALKPLPVSDPARVVRIERWFESGNHGDVQYAFSYPEYVYCRDHNDVFASLVAATWPLRLFAALPRVPGGEAGEPEQAHGQLVSANYFADLGVAARLG